MNQNFDLSGVTLDSRIAMPTTAEKKRDEADVKEQMTSRDVMNLFSMTFNLKGSATNPFQGMVDKYKDVFQGEIDKVSLQLAHRHVGETIQNKLKEVLELYDKTRQK